jgi:hypothetical protein
VQLTRSIVVIAAFVAAPACGPDPDHCEGNVAVQCGTDEWGATHCSSEDCREGFCVEVKAGPLHGVQCAPEPEPRLACLDEELHANATGYWTCVGAEKYSCSGGYRLATTDCGAPELCHVGFAHNGNRNVHCILSAIQDPRCLPLPDRNYFIGIMPICDGMLALGCFDGYLTTVEDCAATGGTCQDGNCRQ